MKPKISSSPEYRSAERAPGRRGMAREERESFELRLEREPVLCSQTVRLLELATDSLPATHRSICVPRSGIKQEVLRAVDTSKGAADLMAQFARLANHCLVITDSERRLTWANDAFSLMCGYSLSELKGNNPGRLLQGELTDSASTKRIRRALDKLQVVSEELVNYHKNGRPYWVRLTISPVIDAEGKARGFFALGNEIKDRRIPR